jgi:tRNA(Ile)-lysidine synthase
MLKKFVASLTQKCQIDRSKSILVGVSGGIDSVCLLDLFFHSGYPVVAAHFDHGIRSESNLDARFVEGVARDYGIAYILGVENIPKYARDRGLSIEEAGRSRRYQFLFKQAKIHDCQAVAVAHNADDQVETILMHLLRGSGLDGLKGMTYHMLPNPWSDSIPLVRPLLGTWRSEIELYCSTCELDSVIDHSNLDTRYFRNRLRHELIPELETYIPGVRKRLWQTADLLQADFDTLEEVTLNTLSSAVVRSGPGYIAFKLPEFNRQLLGLKRRLFRKAIIVLRPDARDVDYAIVRRVMDFAAQPSATGKADIGLGLRVLMEEDLLVLATWEADLFFDEWPQIGEESLLEIPGVSALRNGWTLQVELVEDIVAAEKTTRNNPDPYQAWMELPLEQKPFFIRAREPGDVFKPLGMGGKTVKLSDLMINLKIPQRARAHWPLVCIGEEIAWVPGYRLSHVFRLTSRDRKVVHMQVYRT